MSNELDELEKTIKFITEEQYRELAKQQGISGEELDRVKALDYKVHLRALHKVLSSETDYSYVIETGRYKTRYQKLKDIGHLTIETKFTPSDSPPPDESDYERLLNTREKLNRLVKLEKYLDEDAPYRDGGRLDKGVNTGAIISAKQEFETCLKAVEKILNS